MLLIRRCGFLGGTRKLGPRGVSVASGEKCIQPIFGLCRQKVDLRRAHACGNGPLGECDQFAEAWFGVNDTVTGWLSWKSSFVSDGTRTCFPCVAA